MRIWLITVGEPLPIDGDSTRLLRAGILFGHLTGEGHEVVWWTSTFNHWRKQHYFDRDASIRVNEYGQLKLLHGTGYRKNISFRRVLDHWLVARAFARLAEGEPAPDVILCSLPTLELSVAATRYGLRHGLPVIIDIRDLWPDVMIEMLPAWLRGLARLVALPMQMQARRACRAAFALTANSPPFLEWGLQRAGRSGASRDRVFPFGYVTTTPSESVLFAARQRWQEFGLEEGGGAFVACFFGTMGHQFDLETVIDAALQLEQEGRDFLFVLCGVGEQLEGLKARAGNSRNILFPGWVGKVEIHVLMRIASVGLAPYRNHAGFVGNLPNKPIEYMAGSLPVISSLGGYLSDFLAQKDCGVTYADGDAKALRDTLRCLSEDRDRLNRMAANAHKTFIQQFDAEKVYGDMSAYLRDMATAYPSGHLTAP